MMPVLRGRLRRLRSAAKEPLRRCGAVAQMGERCNRTAEVRGSIPLSSTTRAGARRVSLANPQSAKRGRRVGDAEPVRRRGFAAAWPYDASDSPMKSGLEKQFFIHIGDNS